MELEPMDALKSKIRHVPDFPKAGILFYDITTLLKDRKGFHDTIDGLKEHYGNSGVDMVIGIEALRKPETNIVNSVAEALRLAREVGDPRSSTAPTASRFTRTRSAAATASSSSTICWPPAALRRL